MTRNATYDIRGKDVPDRYDGRIRFSLGVEPGKRADRMRTRLNDLRHEGNYDVLDAIQRGRITPQRAVNTVREMGVHRAAKELRSEAVSAEAGSIGTVRENAERYLDEYETDPNRGAESYEVRRKQLSRVLDQPTTDGTPLGDKPLDRVTAMDVERAVRSTELSGWSQQGSKAALVGLWTSALRREREEARTQNRTPRFDANPAKKANVADPTPNVEAARPEQYEALLEASEPYQEAYLRLAGQVGLRSGELRHLRMGLDYAPERREIVLQARGPDPACSCPQCTADGWSPKSTNSARTIRLPEARSDVLGALETYLTLEPAETGDKVLRNPRTGGMWTHQSLNRDLRLLCESKEIKYGRDVPGGITMHSLRHMCATQLLYHGVDIARVAHLLGHSVQTAADYYLKVTLEDVEEALAQGPGYGP